MRITIVLDIKKKQKKIAVTSISMVHLLFGLFVSYSSTLSIFSSSYLFQYHPYFDQFNIAKHEQDGFLFLIKELLTLSKVAKDFQTALNGWAHPPCLVSLLSLVFDVLIDILDDKIHPFFLYLIIVYCLTNSIHNKHQYLIAYLFIIQYFLSFKYFITANVYLLLFMLTLFYLRIRLCFILFTLCWPRLSIHLRFAVQVV